MYRVYLHCYLPFIGSVLTGKRSAYAYLGESIEQFPNGSAMCDLIAQNGFEQADFEPLTGGIVTVYTAAKS
jgi:demethylmenaquinone methyltransferase / 2-methoxy-6-polyprenyl-1,4-benzoquinol methylase